MNLHLPPGKASTTPQSSMSLKNFIMLVVKGWTEYEHTGHGGQLADDIQTSVTGTSTLTEVRPCFVSVHHSGSNNNCHTQYRTNFWTQVLIECIPFTFTTKPLFTQKIFTHHSIMCCELDHQGCPLVSCHCLRLYKGHVLHEYNIYFMLIMYLYDSQLLGEIWKAWQLSSGLM